MKIHDCILLRLNCGVLAAMIEQGGRGLGIQLCLALLVPLLLGCRKLRARQAELATLLVSLVLWGRGDEAMSE